VRQVRRDERLSSERRAAEFGETKLGKILVLFNKIPYYTGICMVLGIILGV
jgi:hypothetical protein